MKLLYCTLEEDYMKKGHCLFPHTFLFRWCKIKLCCSPQNWQIPVITQRLFKKCFILVRICYHLPHSNTGRMKWHKGSVFKKELLQWTWTHMKKTTIITKKEEEYALANYPHQWNHRYQTNKSVKTCSPSLSVVFVRYTPVWHRQLQKNLQILTELYKLNRPHLSQSSSTQMHIERLLFLILRTADLALIQKLSKHTC